MREERTEVSLVAETLAKSALEAGVVGEGLALVEPRDGAQELNLDYAATTPALQAALDAVIEFLPNYGSVHRGGGRRSARSTEAYEAARRDVAAFVGCPPGSSVIFVRNTTEAANVLAAALPRASRVLCAPFEHHANLLPWRAHEVDYLPFASSAEEFLELVETALAAAAAADRPYGLLAVSGASNVTGEIPPMTQLAATAHRHGARIFVDAAQLAPHRPIDIASADVDCLAFSGHKLYAPFGIGALIVRDADLADGLPLLRGGGAVRLVSLDDVAWEALPHRYEAGTPNTVGAVALAAACRTLTAHGMEALADAEKRLSERLWDGLTGIPRVTLLRMWDSAPDRVGVAAFTIDGTDSRNVSELLSERFGIAVRSGAFCAHPLVSHLLDVEAAETAALFDQLEQGESIRLPGAVRASIGIGIDDAAIDRLVSAVTTIAAAS